MRTSKSYKTKNNIFSISKMLYSQSSSSPLFSRRQNPLSKPDLNPIPPQEEKMSAMPMKNGGVVQRKNKFQK
jgi:hypothetical protein